MMHVWKTLKVFVSSTFKDLEKERDRLAKVFRRIQENIFSQRLHLIPYDLRWKEQNEKNLVQWCLNMVSQVDYFVGILGYRYGWRPPYQASGQDNREKFSITEMEIRKALEVVPKSRRFFCFGDLAQYSESQLSSETKEDIESLKLLQQILEKQGERIFVYHNSEEALSMIQTELEQIIQKEYPLGQKAELETYKLQEAISEIITEKCRGFVGREKYLDQIYNFAKQEISPNYLVIHAVAGTGKSALLAQFFQTWKNKHSSIPVIVHYMSMAGNNRSLRGILQSIGEQLKNIGRMSEELEILTDKLSLQIRSALQNQKLPIILLIDGLDESDEDSQELTWLPTILPSHVRIILSTRPVAIWEKIRRNFTVMNLELPPLEDREIKEVITGYQQRHNLKLLPEEQNFLAQRAAGNPLFLKVAMDEMVRGGLAVGQLATTVDALFHQILQRLANSVGEKIIHDYLGFIAAGRNGLTEAELREIIHEDYPVTTTEDFFTLVFSSLANFVIPREKMLAFFHPEFERSVKMLLGKGGMRNYHRRLAAYFSSKWNSYERALLELPYQLQSGEQYEMLLKILGDINFLEAKSIAGMLIELRQDFQYALEAKAVPLPSDLTIELFPLVEINQSLLALIAHILDLDFNFLLRHPQYIFQSCWNQGYWHDAPESAEYYQNSSLGNAPWNLTGPKLYRVVEYWRNARKKSPWIRTLRPLPERLDSPLVKIFRGHEDIATAIAFMEDGKKIVSGGYDKTIHVWDVSTGECLNVFPGHEEFVCSIATSPNGKYIASGAGDGCIRIWDGQTGNCIQTLRDHYKAVASLKFTPDGEKLLSAGKDKVIRVWDCQTWQVIQNLKGHKDMINGIELSKDGKIIVSGSWDNTIRMWNLQTGECLWTASGHTAHIRCIAINPDGKTIVSGSDDQTVRVWDQNGKCLTVLHRDSIVFSVAFSFDGKKIISGDYGVLSVWDVSSFQCELAIRGHESSIFNLAISPDNRYVISCSSDKTIRMWDIHSAGLALQVDAHTKIIYDFNLSKDGSKAITASRDSNLMLWNTANGKRELTLTGHKDPARSACFSLNDTIIISGADDKTIKIWDAHTGACVRELSGHEKNVTAVFASKDGKWIVSGDRDGVIRLWDASSGNCILHFSGHSKDVRSLYLTPKGKIISGGEDYIIRIWDVSDKQSRFLSNSKDSSNIEVSCLKILTGHKDGVLGVAINSDETEIYSTSRDNQFRIWNLNTGEYQTFSGTGNVEQWTINAPYYALTQDWETVLFKHDTQQPYLFFPAALRQVNFHTAGIIGGYAGVYTYLLKLD